MTGINGEGLSWSPVPEKETDDDGDYICEFEECTNKAGWKYRLTSDILYCCSECALRWFSDPNLWEMKE